MQTSQRKVPPKLCIEPKTFLRLGERTWIQTQDRLVMRQQCKPLINCAAPETVIKQEKQKFANKLTYLQFSLQNGQATTLLSTYSKL